MIFDTCSRPDRNLDLADGRPLEPVISDLRVIVRNATFVFWIVSTRSDVKKIHRSRNTFASMSHTRVDFQDSGLMVIPQHHFHSLTVGGRFGPPVVQNDLQNSGADNILFCRHPLRSGSETAAAPHRFSTAAISCCLGDASAHCSAA